MKNNAHTYFEEVLFWKVELLAIANVLPFMHIIFEDFLVYSTVLKFELVMNRVVPESWISGFGSAIEKYYI